MNKNEKQVSDLCNLIEGWTFRFDEISPNYYCIEGSDKFGHLVPRTCSEPELVSTLEACINDARDIQKQIQEK